MATSMGGRFAGDRYVLLNNEYGEMSPYYAVAELIDDAFRGKNSVDIFLDYPVKEGFRERSISYVESSEIAEVLGFELQSIEESERYLSPTTSGEEE